MNAWLTAALAVLAAAAWLAHSWWFPWRRCPACMGRQGRGRGSTPRAFNRCRTCKGEGELPRIGARLISKATGRPVRGSKEN